LPPWARRLSTTLATSSSARAIPLTISYVIVGKPHPGAIVNWDAPPRVGDRVQLGDELFEVTEVTDLIPPRGEFAYLHVTCRPVQEGA